MTPSQQSAEFLANQIVQKIEGMIHEYDYNRPTEIIVKALTDYAEERVREAYKKGQDEANVYLPIEKESILGQEIISRERKEARAEDLEEAAKIADDYISLRDSCIEIASRIRALINEVPGPRPLDKK